MPAFLPISLPSPAALADSLRRRVGLANTLVVPFSIRASSNPKKDLLGKVDPGFTVPDLSASGTVSYTHLTLPTKNEV